MRVGAHMANGPVSGADLALFNTGHLNGALLMWYHDPALVAQVGGHVIVRLPDLMRGADKHVPAHFDYADECAATIRKFYGAGVREFQLDNEPNWTGSWGGDRMWEWRATMLDVLNGKDTHPGLKRLVADLPGVRLGFTPFTYPNVDAWRQATMDVAALCDWIAIHCYWQAPGDTHNPVFGGQPEVLRGLYPGKPQIVTEAGNSINQASDAPSFAELQRLRAEQYPAYVTYLRDLGYVEGVYFYILGGTADWQGFWLTATVMNALAPAVADPPPKEPALAFNIDKTTYRSPNFWTPAYFHTHFGVRRNPSLVLLHDTEGNFPYDLRELMGQGTRQVSSHYYIKLDGTTYELVDPDNIAWHAYVKPEWRIGSPELKALWERGDNENCDSIGIEMEGLRMQPKTPEQIAACAELVKYLIGRYPAIKTDRLHIVGHYEINKEKVDPLPWDWGSFMKSLLSGVVSPPPTPDPTPAPVPPQTPPSDPHTSSGGQPVEHLFFPETGHTVQGGFLDFFNANGGLARLGYPLTDEGAHPETPGVTIQVFENAWLETWPGTVRFGAIGRYYLKAIGKL